MDQDQYEKQHDYLNRLEEVPTKLMALNKELDLLGHHVVTVEFKLRMLDDMIIKAREIEKHLGSIQYFLADDIEPIPGNPREPGITTFASNVKFETLADAAIANISNHGDYPVMNAPRGGIKYGKTV